MGLVRDIGKELRIKQYTKNVLIFAAPLFGGVLFDTNVLFRCILAFIAFSCTASAVYILNDIMDVEKDRQHPTKCQRPIASGAISVNMAYCMLIFLLLTAATISITLENCLFLILLLYFIMNVSYSMKLKHVVIVDIFIIAAGFVLRAFAGVVASKLGVTSWFILCVFTLCLFLALAKRRNEILLMKENIENSRKVLKYYSVSLIDQLANIVAGVMLTSYALFAAQAQSKIFNNQYPVMMLTVPVVIYGVFRYMYLVQIKGLGERPEDVLVHDKHILGTVLLYVLIIIAIRNV